MNQDNQQNQPEKINLLHQDDIQPDIQKDLSEKPKKQVCLSGLLF